MRKYRLLFVCMAMFLSAVFFQACQNAQTAPYTKYTSDAEVPRISIEDARREFDNGTAVFIDTRGDFQYKQEHIAGSISSTNIGPVEEKYPNIPKGKKIIVYCS